MKAKMVSENTKLENKKFSIVNDAVEKILEGVQKMFDEQDKKNDAKYATKEDLKRETGFVRQDINDLRAEISTMPTRKEFNSLKGKLTVN